jgi:hypothetical protein
MVLSGRLGFVEPIRVTSRKTSVCCMARPWHRLRVGRRLPFQLRTNRVTNALLGSLQGFIPPFLGLRNVTKTSPLSGTSSISAESRKSKVWLRAALFILGESVGARSEARRLVGTADGTNHKSLLRRLHLRVLIAISARFFRLCLQSLWYDYLTMNCLPLAIATLLEAFHIPGNAGKGCIGYGPMSIASSFLQTTLCFSATI